MIGKYHRRYVRHVKKLVKAEVKAEYHSWMARLQQALDDEELINRFTVSLDELVQEHPVDIREREE